MIELALLGLLTDQDLHGYELKKQLTELLGSWSTVSFGSLYPALARLAKAQLVMVVETNTIDEPTVPMTGALSGELAAFRHRLNPKAISGRGRRGKKVYGITVAGRDRFHELLTAPGPDDDRTFAVRVAFCRHLDPTERLALFEQRKRDLATQLAARRRSAPVRGDLYRHSLRDREARALGHDLDWLDELIATTHEASVNPPPEVSSAPTITSFTLSAPADLSPHAPAIAGPQKAGTHP